MVRPARALAGALEPVVGQVSFAPECHENYRGLGFDPSPGVRRGVATTGRRDPGGTRVPGRGPHDLAERALT